MRFALAACVALMTTSVVAKPTILPYLLPPEGSSWYNVTVQALQAPGVALKARRHLNRREPFSIKGIFRGIKAAATEVKDVFQGKSPGGEAGGGKAGALAGLLGMDCTPGDNHGCAPIPIKDGKFADGKCSCMVSMATMMVRTSHYPLGNKSAVLLTTPLSPTVHMHTAVRRSWTAASPFVRAFGEHPDSI